MKKWKKEQEIAEMRINNDPRSTASKRIIETEKVKKNRDEVLNLDKRDFRIMKITFFSIIISMGIILAIAGASLVLSYANQLFTFGQGQIKTPTVVLTNRENFYVGFGLFFLGIFFMLLVAWINSCLQSKSIFKEQSAIAKTCYILKMLFNTAGIWTLFAGFVIVLAKKDVFGSLNGNITPINDLYNAIGISLLGIAIYSIGFVFQLGNVAKKKDNANKTK